MVLTLHYTQSFICHLKKNQGTFETFYFFNLLAIETWRQVHLPMKQCLINGGRHQLVTNKGMDRYRWTIGHMEVRPDRIKLQAVVVWILLYGYITWTLTKCTEKKLDVTQECCEEYQTSPGGSTSKRSSCKATYHPSRNQSNLDEPDMPDTAGEVETSS